jgi:hypothetical protein
MLSTGTDIDTIDFMGEEYGIPVNSPTSGGLSPFGTAFAAARSRQEQENPNDPGGGRFMFDRKDDRGLREFHTGRADDIESDASAAASNVNTSTGGVSDLDLIGEESRRAAVIAADRIDIEGEDTREDVVKRTTQTPTSVAAKKDTEGTGSSVSQPFVPAEPDSDIISLFYQWLLDQGKPPTATGRILNRSLGDQDATSRN